MPESKEKSTEKPKKTTASTSKKKTTKTKTAPKTTAKTTQKTTRTKTQEKKEEKPKTAKEKMGGEEKYEEEDWGEKLSVIAQRAFDTVKEGVQKLSDFASDSSQVAKVKFEILNLSSDRKSLLREVGEKLWRLHKEKSVGNIEEKFKVEFNRLADYEKKIAVKEKEIKTVSEKEGN